MDPLSYRIEIDYVLKAYTKFSTVKKNANTQV